MAHLLTKDGWQRRTKKAESDIDDDSFLDRFHKNLRLMIFMMLSATSTIRRRKWRSSSRARHRWWFHDVTTTTATTTTARFLVAIVAILAVSSCKIMGVKANNNEEGHEKMDLQPFQIRLQYDDNVSMQSTDEMMVLNSTQQYLSECLGKTLPDFSYLMLYQFFRDYVVDHQDHYSKVAMNGIVYFRGGGGGTTTAMTQYRRPEDVQLLLLQNLVGENVTKYIDVLHDSGLTNVIDATLLSIEGTELVMLDGQIVKVDGGDDGDVENDGSGINDDNDDDDTGAAALGMDDGMMKRMTLLLCLLIPGIAIFVAIAVFACRSAREINWRTSKQQRASEKQPVWQTSQHLRYAATAGGAESSSTKRRMIETTSSTSEDDHGIIQGDEPGPGFAF